MPVLVHTVISRRNLYVRYSLKSFQNEKEQLCLKISLPSFPTSFKYFSTLLPTLSNYLLVISRLKQLFHLLSHLLSCIYFVHFHNPPFPHHKITPQNNSEVGGVFLLFSTLQKSAKNSTSSCMGQETTGEFFKTSIMYSPGSPLFQEQCPLRDPSP